LAVSRKGRLTGRPLSLAIMNARFVPRPSLGGVCLGGVWWPASVRRQSIAQDSPRLIPSNHAPRARTFIHAEFLCAKYS
jgi:hypothetical protein